MDNAFLRKFAYHIYQYLTGGTDVYRKVLFVGKYNEILKIFLSLSEYINIVFMEMDSERHRGYAGEFIMEIDSDLRVVCYRKDRIPDLEADIAFVIDNCNVDLSDCPLICECSLSDDEVSTFPSFVWR